MPSTRLTRFIVLGLVLGIIAGYVCYASYPGDSAEFSKVTALLPTTFLRLIKMIIAPLVFCDAGGRHREDGRHRHGRPDRRARRSAGSSSPSLVSLTLGLVLVSLLRAGQGDASADSRGGRGVGRRRPTGLSSRNFISHTVPDQHRRRDGAQRDPADRRVLAVLRHRRWRRSARRATSVIDVLDARRLTSCCKVTGYVMLFAPLAVFGALASTIAKEGLGIITRLRHVHGRVLSRHPASCGSC